MGGVDVQPHAVAPADCGDLHERVEGPDGRGAGTGHHRHDGAVLGAEPGELFVQLQGIHAPALVEPDAHRLAAAQAEDAGGARDAVVGLGVGEEDGLASVAGQPLVPRVADGHVARRQQGRQVRQGAAVRDRPGEGVWCPTDGFAQLPDHGQLHGARPRPHLVDGHHLVGDRADGVEQAGERHRRRHLMADVARVVEIEPALEHDVHEVGELVGDGGRVAGGIRERRRAVGRRPRRRPAGRGAAHVVRVQERPRLANRCGRLGPRQHGAVRPLGARQVGAQQTGQPTTCVLQKTRVVGGGDTLPSRAELVRDCRHGARTFAAGGRAERLFSVARKPGATRHAQTRPCRSETRPCRRAAVRSRF